VSHDEIAYGDAGFLRETNRAGGIEGGITNGSPVRVRAHMKPLSTLMRPLATVDVETKQPERAIRERSDVCAVPAAGVAAEHVTAWVLATEAVRKFGGDTVGDFEASADAYRRRLEGF
jgi:chorismate synthase